MILSGDTSSLIRDFCAWGYVLMDDHIQWVQINLGNGDLGELPNHLDWSDDSPSIRMLRMYNLQAQMPVPSDPAAGTPATTQPPP